MKFKITKDLMYQFAELKYRELYPNQKGGSRVNIRAYNLGKTGAEGSRANCTHKHKHIALEAAMNDYIGFAAFCAEKRKNYKHGSSRKKKRIS